MSNIIKILGREIIDSRGYPTVEAEVHLNDGNIGRASVPSGASTGSKEALEKRDHNKKRFLGKGVKNAIHNINNKIANSILKKDPQNQNLIDQIMIELDGTENKSELGANAILAVSLANAKAAALTKRIPLYEHISDLNNSYKKYSMPLPMVNIINGGKHADNNIDIQEFMIQPVSAKNIKEAICIVATIFHTLKVILKKNNLITTVGDEGGYAPSLSSNFEALDILVEAVKESGYKLLEDITFAIDCAASELYKDNQYHLENEKKKYFSSKEFVHFFENLISKYPIVSIEDGLHESDWNGFLYQTKILGDKIQLVGDDLFVTNPFLLKKGIEKNIANSILIKPNQIGTLTETLSTIKIAKSAGYSTIISHRSGETEDTFISDLAVGTASGQIKTGSICRTDRVSKYNQLIRIEEELGEELVPFYGIKAIKNQN